MILIAIERSIETVFELIRDLRGYRSWLPASEAFRELTDISDDPVRVGTTYVDRGQATVTYGEVIAMEPPRLIAFRQTTTFKRGIVSGELTVSINYRLEEGERGGTIVTREVRMRTSGTLIALRPVLALVIRRESARILQRMKMYLEARVRE